MLYLNEFYLIEYLHYIFYIFYRIFITVYCGQILPSCVCCPSAIAWSCWFLMCLSICSRA